MHIQPGFDAPIFCFSATTQETGRFHVPKNIQAAMGWQGDECLLNFLVFDAAGRHFQISHSTTSGGTVDLGKGTLTAKELIQVVAFRP